MEAKEAISLAKALVAEMFASELTSPPTLEEIWFDEKKDEWFVTVGVRRPTNDVEVDRPWDVFSGKRKTIPDLKVVRISNKAGTIPKIVSREAISV